MSPNIHCRASSSVRGADSSSYVPGLHTGSHALYAVLRNAPSLFDFGLMSKFKAKLAVSQG